MHLTGKCSHWLLNFYSRLLKPDHWKTNGAPNQFILTRTENGFSSVDLMVLYMRVVCWMPCVGSESRVRRQWVRHWSSSSPGFKTKPENGHTCTCSPLPDDSAQELALLLDNYFTLTLASLFWRVFLSVPSDAGFLWTRLTMRDPKLPRMETLQWARLRQKQEAVSLLILQPSLPAVWSSAFTWGQRSRRQ